MATAWRKACNSQLRYSRIEAARVLNIGATQEYDDKEGHLYRDYFPGSEYWTIDKIGIDGGRHVAGDLVDRAPDMGKFDMVLLMNVLEHVENPFAIAEAADNLVAPGGRLFVTVPFFYPVHYNGYMKDYWRFTPSALRLLFPKLNERYILSEPGKEVKTPVGYIGVFDRE